MKSNKVTDINAPRHSGPKYDPATFIVSASDGKGHSERVWCRIQPGMDRQLDIIFNSRKFPFRTKGDIIRWAIDCAIRDLSEMEEVPSVMAQVDAVMDILRDEMFNHDFMSMFEALSRVVQTHLGAQAMGEAQRLVAVTRHKFERMPDGYWKDRYINELDTKFGYLLKAPGAPSHDEVVKAAARMTTSRPKPAPVVEDDYDAP